MFVSDHDPFRTPDWRWQRAAWLHEQGRYARRGRDDEYVTAARDFLTRLDRAGTDEVALESLACRCPGIYYARQLRLREDANDRWVVEARVLADQPAAEIADRQMTSAEVVLWYERLFFDVRPRLAHRDWVCNRVLGQSFHQGVKMRQFDLLLKLYALVGGPVVVDALVEQSSGPRRPSSRGEVAGFFTADKADTVARAAALSARCMPLLAEPQHIIFDAHHKLLQLERDQSTAQGGLPITANVQAALRAVVFRTPRQLASDLGPATPALAGGAVEPRAEALAAAATGRDYAAADDDLFAGFTIPEAPSNG